jgi:hypothetical protein
MLNTKKKLKKNSLEKIVEEEDAPSEIEETSDEDYSEDESRSEEEEDEEEEDNESEKKVIGRKRHAKASSPHKGKRSKQLSVAAKGKKSKEKEKESEGSSKKKPPKVTTNSARVRDVSKPATNYIKDKFILGNIYYLNYLNIENKIFFLFR